MLRSAIVVCTLAILLAASSDNCSAQMPDRGGSPVVPASAAMAVGGGGGPQAAFPSGTRAFGRSWGSLSPQDWERFYHYPYVYYPHNFWGNNYYRSSDSLYYRYPSEMRIPVYNKKWHNYYPSARPYYKGHHFVLDVF